MAPFFPCKHDSELAMVKDQFYPQHMAPDVFSPLVEDMRKHAVDRVNVWLFKAGQLPHPVVATALLTEALLHDEPAHREGLLSNNAIKSIYAMAFCKFVNGFVDRDVARSTTAPLVEAEEKSEAVHRGERSMYAQAVKIGMPEEFVDLRHEIVHGQTLPSWSLLNKMTTRALDWLWGKWWAKNATGDPGRALREIEERRLAWSSTEGGMLPSEDEAARNLEVMNAD